MTARFDGVIRDWNAERGFGFIQPRLGGQDVFVHVKACRGMRPAVGLAVSFAVEMNEQGKKRAVDVDAVRTGAMAHSVRARNRVSGSAAWGTASFFALPAFGLLYLVVAVVWRLPLWVLAAYALLSVIAFATYGLDKAAAQTGRRRIPEQTLHVLALVGGWPGALVAQQWLRHKSSKTSFRAGFWLTVVLNVVAFVLLASPIGRHWLSP